MKHPAALFVDDRLVVFRARRVAHAIAKGQGLAVAAVQHDVGLPVVQHPEVLLVLLAGGLQVPEAREAGEALAQPLVVIGVEVHPDAPPLVGHLVRAEELIEPVVGAVDERARRQVNQPRKCLAVEIGNLGDVELLHRHRAVNVLEELERVQRILAHLLLGVGPREQARPRTRRRRD